MAKYYISDPAIFKAVRFIEVIIKGGKPLEDALRISSRHYNLDHDILKQEYEKFSGDKTAQTRISNRCPTCNRLNEEAQVTQVEGNTDEDWVGV